MKITADKPQNSQVKLTIELSEAELAKYYDQAVAKVAQQVNVKGFRPGKAPRAVIEQQFEKSYLMAQAIDLALAPSYVEAIQDQKLEPIARPEITVTSQEPLIFTAEVPLYPEVKLDNYKKISVKANEIKVDNKDVEEEINHYLKSSAKYNEVDRASKLTDKVEIDFDGFDEGGAALDGTTSKNHPLVLGDKTFIPGFEEEVVGMKAGDEKEFDITFPKDYFHKAFQNKKVKFKVKVNRVLEVSMPELDAEYIKKVSGKEQSIDEFKAQVKSNLEKAKKTEEQNRLENEVLEEIMKKTKVELPKALVEDEIHYMIDQQKQEIESRGMKFDDYLQAVKKTHDDLHHEYEEEAKKRLTLRFGVQEIFKLEKIEVSEEETQKAFTEQMETFASMNFQPSLEQQKVYKNQLASKLKMEKLIAIFTK